MPSKPTGRARRKEVAQAQGDLLALIFGDGGHRIQEIGWLEATEEAIDRVNSMRTELARYRAKVRSGQGQEGGEGR